ncbi:cuticle protein 12.5-like [Uranotaenia lowii]|uniref:cuticle protein 12.5-like n=1 Tax=Uranotaenia lowii TaxID=190385 RepID=UPI00247987F5|nr:cuticle protein 12.5-like [Uranotaenia lowii]
MKFFIVLIAVVAAVCADDMPAESMKSKRGLSLSLGYHGYHAPAVVSHAAYAAPVIAHSAPLVAAPTVYHAPAAITKTYVAHTPVVHHAPAYAAYHAPAVVAHAPLAYSHAPIYHAFHRR